MNYSYHANLPVDYKHYDISIDDSLEELDTDAIDGEV